MAQFILKRGNLAGLANLPVKDGQFIVVKDERSIYVDTEAGRIRLGDFQEFASIEALNDNVNPSTTALYYVSDVNVLAKWNGSEYIQINRDTGATSVEVVGEGNAVTAASYNAVTRKLTLTKGTVFATDADHKALAKKVNDLEVVGGQANVIESVKVNGVALEVVDKAVNVEVPTGALASKDIISINEVDAGIKASLAKADSAIQEHQSLAAYRTSADQDVIDNGIKDRVKALEDADVQDALTEEQLAAVNSGITSAKVAIYDGYANGKENVGVAESLVNAAKSDLEGQISAVSAVAEAATTVAEVDAQIGAKITALDLANTYEPKGKAQEVVDALNLAATYEPIGAETRAKAYADSLISDADLGQYTTEQEVKDIVDAVVVGAVEGDTLTGLANLVEYLNTHGAEAKDMAAAIDVLEGQVETIEGKPAYGITATQISNWDNEVGAKALAETKTTATEVKAQIEAYEYATEADLTLAEGRISTLETNSATKTELNDVDAKFANYNTTVAQKAIDDAQDARIKAIEDDYLVEADIANFETKENVKKVADDLAAYKTANDAAVAGKVAQGDFDTLNAKVDVAKVSEAIATALQQAKDYADENDANTIYDDSEVRELIASNAKAIADQATSDAATFETKADAAQKLVDAKAYTDAALLWGEF